MGGRPRIVAAQALIVGALLMVVYLTLLRPDDESALTAVQAPGADPQIAQRTGQAPARGAGRRDGAAARRRAARPGSGAAAAARRGEPAGGAPLAGLPGTVPGVPAVPGVPGTVPGSDGDSPADDQYGDALAQLEARLY